MSVKAVKTGQRDGCRSSILPVSTQASRVCEFDISRSVEMHVEIRVPWIEDFAHLLGFSEWMVAPESSPLKWNMFCQHLAQFLELRVHGWIASENADNSVIVLEADACLFKVLQRDHSRIAAKIRTLSAVEARLVAGSGGPDLDHSVQPLSGLFCAPAAPFCPRSLLVPFILFLSNLRRSRMRISYWMGQTIVLPSFRLAHRCSANMLYP